MSYKKIIPYINAEHELPAKVSELAAAYSHSGSDEVFIYNYSMEEEAREEFLSLAKDLSKILDVPFVIGCHVERLEDIKKAIYTGAKGIIIKYSQLKNPAILKEAAERFGKQKILLALDLHEYMAPAGKEAIEHILQEDKLGGLILRQDELKQVELSEELLLRIEESPLPVILQDSLLHHDLHSILALKQVSAVTSNYFEAHDIMEAKLALKAAGIPVNTYESSVSFSELKLDAQGLIPVVVQDYRTSEVLMLAYMNEEAYNKTIATGRMTYYSRSRQALWRKGDTSGHVQYLKELSLDCDKDTLLAKVHQVGAACHTGSRSCFYTELLKKEYKDRNPLHVFQDVYDVILDRKTNPKEGSYTNYLFDKGIDKILKKCGEEATEIVIAAKNPGAEELRYEIADYLYHLMVLMAQCDLTWEDITTELAHRK